MDSASQMTNGDRRLNCWGCIALFVGTLTTLVWGIIEQQSSIAVATHATEGLESKSRISEDVMAYMLRPGETVRHVEQPTLEDRALILADALQPIYDPIISLTIRWEQSARVSQAEIGVAYRNRTLNDVLTKSLGMPIWRFVNPERGYGIQLPGDWVVLSGADECDMIASIEAIVRKKASPQFRFVESSRSVVEYRVTGIPAAPIDVLDLGEQPADCPVEPVKSGSLDVLLADVQKGLGVPIRCAEANRAESRLFWRNYLPARNPTRSAASPELVERTVEQIEDWLGVSIVPSERPVRVWQLSDDGAVGEDR